MADVSVPCCWCSGSGKLRHPRLSEALGAIASGLRTSAQVGRAIGVGSPDRGQLLYIAGAADALAHLLTHPGGTEYAVGQLRELRRALKDKP